MDPAKYEYQSDFARKYVAQGRAEGRTDLVLKLLTLKFGKLSVSSDSIGRTARALGSARAHGRNPGPGVACAP